VQEGVRVNQYGGTVERDGHKVTTFAQSIHLETGEESVVFLEKAIGSGGYSPAYGGAGILKIDPLTDTCRIPPIVQQRVPEYRERSSVPKAELLATLRSFKTKPPYLK
jgi:hypothetical protein